MQLLSVRFISGPNVYSYRPVIKAMLDIGIYEEIPSNIIVGFIARLLALLPGLKQHTCSRGYPGGFVERLDEGTYLGHIFEHVAIELQSLAGREYKASFGKTRGSGRPGVYSIVFGCKSGLVGETAAEAAYKLLTAVLEEQDFSVDEAVARLKQAGENSKLGPSTKSIFDAAQRRGIPVLRPDYETNFLVLGYGCKQQRVWASITGRTSSVAVDLASDKFLTNKLLCKNALPVPEGEVVTNIEGALTAFKNIKQPVVVKPTGGNHGNGVTINIIDEEGLTEAFRLASDYDHRVLVEEYITGRQYRFCVVNGKVAAVAERIPAHVVGDGQHTISELVEITNLDPNRGSGHSRALTRLVLDEGAFITLSKQNLNPESVPTPKQIVFIRDNANLSAGATAKDVTELVHPSTIAQVERAVKIIGLDIAGVDVVIPNIEKPLQNGYGAIIEINAAPGLRMHIYPSEGKPRPVGEAILEYLFPCGDNGRIPILSITGTNGKTTVTRLISHIFKEAGYRTGMTSTHGVYIDQECILEGDTTGPASAAMVLADSSVEIAVLEVARGGIIRGGLGYDYADIGIITNITDDHVGQDGVEDLDDLANIKSLVIERVLPDGAVLLNADDSLVASLKSRANAEIVYFSTQADNIVVRRHLGEGGKACFVKAGAIYMAIGQTEHRVIEINHIPITIGGLAQHNIQNAVVAVAACYSKGIAPETISRGLASFSNNPGRLMLLDVKDLRVCVDYAHNPAGCQALANTLRRLHPGRLIGVIAAPGDRRDDTTISLGRIAGQGFDVLYIKEDQDLRGRQAGETAALIARGAIEAGFSPDSITTVLDEREAVASALKQARPGDLVAVFYEQYGAVMETIEQFNVKTKDSIPFMPPACEELIVAGARMQG